MDVEQYLSRIGFDDEPVINLATLEALQRAHLTAVPFENLDVYLRRGVQTDANWSVDKVVKQGRGGWCFELNGAFSALLKAIGFDVLRLGAIVLVGESTEQPNHLTIEVQLDEAYLVDVGLSDSFIRPLPLDRPGPHDGGTGEFHFEHRSDVTVLFQMVGLERRDQIRFQRVARDLTDFDSVSRELQTRDGSHWLEGPFATRLLDGGPDRVTLLRNRLKVHRNGSIEETPVAADEWDDVLAEWFGMRA